jgi:hypothetical protein
MFFVNLANFPSAFAHHAQFFAERWKHHECTLDEVFKGCVLFVESAALEPRTQVGFGVERYYFIRANETACSATRLSFISRNHWLKARLWLAAAQQYYLFVVFVCA